MVEDDAAPRGPDWLAGDPAPSDPHPTVRWCPNPIKRPLQRKPHTPNPPPHPPPPESPAAPCAPTGFERSPAYSPRSPPRLWRPDLGLSEPSLPRSRPMAPGPPFWAAVLLSFLLAAVEPSSAGSVSPDTSRVPTAVDFILRPPETCSTLDRRLVDPVGVIEGDEVTLGRAVNLLHMNKDDYIAVLFYASWCSFSQECKPNFETLASLFPTIRHFAFEESAIRPSIISRYGIHGFPTLFLLNSTMRVRYHGPRTVKSLAAFYTDVSGINASVESTAGKAMAHSLDYIEHKKDAEQENCPFWLARSPENILQQDTYLALATAFVILRLLYLLFPKIVSFARWAWRRHTLFANLMGVHEYFLTNLEQARQKFHRLYPSKRGNLQEGAMNATAWASKSLASVSIGEPSAIGRTNSTSELR